MRWGLVAITLLLLLPGCASRMAARDDAICRSGGADRGTEAYSGCRTQLADEREQVAVQYMQNQHMDDPAPAVNMPYQPPSMPSPSANCLTNGVSAFANCN